MNWQVCKCSISIGHKLFYRRHLCLECHQSVTLLRAHFPVPSPGKARESWHPRFWKNGKSPAGPQQGDSPGSRPRSPHFHGGSFVVHIYHNKQKTPVLMILLPPAFPAIFGMPARCSWLSFGGAQVRVMKGMAPSTSTARRHAVTRRCFLSSGGWL